MSKAKTITLAAYIVLAVIAVAMSGSLAGTIALWILLGLVAAHIVECVVFFKECQRADGSLGLHLVNVFLFGIFHMQEIRANSTSE